MILKTILQILIPVLLIGAILLQMQGSGLSKTFGGGGGEFYRSKQSIEKILIWATVILAGLFGLMSLLFAPR
ncbi:MAG: preprotein translocase subunit SecG [Candidatus Levybacteria bacterium RIFCSPLOWO2_02_FULL_37_10]|nr:MAG: preprotein translocase subunit SecG [Candidatus Levybacteria bacterium RIFCSPHIGHO2_01_FULL_37_33]OGH17523.1 MAG: preprotein translocase subunit SecG [Candidatus Levybacteria bacterium RIFCSPHIGHO2_02_FULL_37_11]OGH29954.1 MAG: preprotein translocase subunit SecG [Candidatus Levybacteria bacterium RIFCSPHIGHO2_12_FULL_37_12]OGH32652.1 MAG: preprotein translocase subunit SecG [Candidatus Levybacteria bacterium RIFCSPLOWO2_01_FULL_36_54]OGH46100.1 MAG: preprotein translocase subunit SecG 